MVCTVFTAYMFTISRLHIIMSLCLLYSHSDLFDFYHYFYMLTNILFYVSSAINPILYNLVSATYRQIFFSTLRYFCMPCRRTPRRHAHPLTRHSISISSNHTLSTNIIKETAYWLDCNISSHTKSSSTAPLWILVQLHGKFWYWVGEVKKLLLGHCHCHVQSSWASQQISVNTKIS